MHPMRPSMLSVLSLMAAFSMLACTDSSASNDSGEADGGGLGPDATRAPDAAAEADSGGPMDAWQPLIAGPWEMPPGQEGYVCVRYTLEEDLLVGAFEAINPVGTHHTLLTVGEPDAEDGVTECTAAENKLRSLYGSGVGTNPMLFPEGVAIRIEAGQQLLLNLHLFNTTTEEMTGTSGTRFRPLPEEELVHEAEGLLAGTVALDIPPQEETHHSGRCQFEQETTVFAVSPHMHQLGIHAKVVAESAGLGDVVLHDGPYSFDEQLYYMIDPIQLAPGDGIRIECTHLNTTDRTVHFGDSSLDEMCLTGVYRYPKYDSPFFCFDR